jgi:Tfp pilus assembly pilus retraction ATPase PilT
VGEIRDRETLEIAMTAAETGIVQFKASASEQTGAQ